MASVFTWNSSICHFCAAYITHYRLISRAVQAESPVCAVLYNRFFAVIYSRFNPLFCLGKAPHKRKLRKTPVYQYSRFLHRLHLFYRGVSCGYQYIHLKFLQVICLSRVSVILILGSVGTSVFLFCNRWMETLSVAVSNSRTAHTVFSYPAVAHYRA